MFKTTRRGQQNKLDLGTITENKELYMFGMSLEFAIVPSLKGMILHCKHHFTRGGSFPPFSTLCTRRQHHGSLANPRFNILFLGRDQFSCLVLNELHAAPGP